MRPDLLPVPPSMTPHRWCGEKPPPSGLPFLRESWWLCIPSGPGRALLCCLSVCLPWLVGWAHSEPTWTNMLGPFRPSRISSSPEGGLLCSGTRQSGRGRGPLRRPCCGRDGAEQLLVLSPLLSVLFPINQEGRTSHRAHPCQEAFWHLPCPHVFNLQAPH